MGAITHLINRQEGIVHGINPRIKQDIVTDTQRLNGAVQSGNNLTHIQFVRGNAEHKMVCLNPGTQTIFAHHHIEIKGSCLQYKISRLNAEQIIDDLKTADVQIHNAITRLMVFLHKFSSFAIKRLPVINPRQRIFFRILMHFHELPVLRYLRYPAPLNLLTCHDIPYPAAYNRRVVGFGDKIGCPHLHSPRFAVAIVIRGHDHHRNTSKLVIPFHHGQHLEPIHYRHNKIHQYNAYWLLFDNRHGLLAIFRLDNLIFFLEKLGQHHPVDFHIIYN